MTEANEMLEEFKDKMELINSYLEDRRKDEEEKRNPIQQELDRLDNDKADKLELFELKNKVDELQQVIDSFNEEDDDDDEDVDSVEEDVLSLNRSDRDQDSLEGEGEKEDDKFFNELDDKPDINQTTKMVPNIPI